MGRYSFSKKERLHLDRDFKKIFSEGRYYPSEEIKIYIYKPEFPRNYSRLGLVVSRKIGTSVERNKLKRRLREIFRLNKDKIKKNVDMIFIPNKNTLKLKYYELEKIILSIWKKAKLFENEENSA